MLLARAFYPPPILASHVATHVKVFVQHLSFMVLPHNRAWIFIAFTFINQCLPLLIQPPSQVNANGNVVRSEILGAVKMKCYLSGMPELRLGLNDKVMFESTGRSQCPSSPITFLLSLGLTSPMAK